MAQNKPKLYLAAECIFFNSFLARVEPTLAAGYLNEAVGHLHIAVSLGGVPKIAAHTNNILDPPVYSGHLSNKTKCMDVWPNGDHFRQVPLYKKFNTLYAYAHVLLPKKHFR